MDEIDAALDFRNVSIVANYIKDRTKNAQFIIISLRSAEAYAYVLFLTLLTQEWHVRAKPSIDWDLQNIQSDTQWAHLQLAFHLD